VSTAFAGSGYLGQASTAAIAQNWVARSRIRASRRVPFQSPQSGPRSPRARRPSAAISRCSMSRPAARPHCRISGPRTVRRLRVPWKIALGSRLRLQHPCRNRRLAAGALAVRKSGVPPRRDSPACVTCSGM